jgi:hypothetical protein
MLPSALGFGYQVIKGSRVGRAAKKAIAAIL